MSWLRGVWPGWGGVWACSGCVRPCWRGVRSCWWKRSSPVGVIIWLKNRTNKLFVYKYPAVPHQIDYIFIFSLDTRLYYKPWIVPRILDICYLTRVVPCNLFFLMWYSKSFDFIRSGAKNKSKLHSLSITENCQVGTVKHRNPKVPTCTEIELIIFVPFPKVQPIVSFEIFFFPKLAGL